MLRMVSSPGFAPKAVTFSCPAPLGFVEDYQQYFRCPLQFDSAADALCFDASMLDAPLAGGNAELARRSERQVFDHLSKIACLDLETQVRMALLDLLPTGTYTRPRGGLAGHGGPSVWRRPASTGIKPSQNPVEHATGACSGVDFAFGYFHQRNFLPTGLQRLQ